MSLRILDGATGTQMQKIGYRSGSCLERFILDHGEALQDLQRRYAAAGSQMVCAPTFGANRLTLAHYGFGEQVREMNLRLAELSQKAVGGRALVAGDIAPTGVPLEPYGDLERDELVEVYAQQARALEEAGVDLFLIETQMSADEAEAALEAVRAESKKPVYVTFTCNDQGKTLYGESVPDLAFRFRDLGVEAFGVNCCGDFDLLERLVPEMAKAGPAVIVKPNAGKPVQVDGVATYRLTPEELALRGKRLYDLGASLLGGCCGTTPAHIEALAKSLCR